MASINKITEIVAATKTIYPYYAKDTDVQTLVRTWEMLLRDYPDDAVSAAFYKCLQTCKMPPTPADVIEKLDGMQALTAESDEELWGVLLAALKVVDRLMYRIQYPVKGQDARAEIEKKWNELPWKLREYIGSKGELMRMARDYDGDDLKYEKTRFLKTAPVLKKREEFHLLMGGNEIKQLKGE